MKSMQLCIKRMFDVIVALIVVVAFFPVWAGFAILIKLTSPGPIFFLQDRPGRNRELFKIYKFRTMYVGSEKMVKGVEVVAGDSRVTPLGAFMRRVKIDEIPQCINILLGNMSLVGPRPERIASLDDYDAEISKRLNVRPGMTGLAQVSGNIYLPLTDRYKLDVYYSEHFSLRLDMQILLRTVAVVLRGEKCYMNRPLIQNDENMRANGSHTH